MKNKSRFRPHYVRGNHQKNENRIYYVHRSRADFFSPKEGRKRKKKSMVNRKCEVDG